MPTQHTRRGSYGRATVGNPERYSFGEKSSFPKKSLPGPAFGGNERFGKVGVFEKGVSQGLDAVFGGKCAFPKKSSFPKKSLPGPAFGGTAGLESPKR